MDNPYAPDPSHGYPSHGDPGQLNHSNEDNSRNEDAIPKGKPKGSVLRGIAWGLIASSIALFILPLIVAIAPPFVPIFYSVAGLFLCVASGLLLVKLSLERRGPERRWTRCIPPVLLGCLGCITMAVCSVVFDRMFPDPEFVRQNNLRQVIKAMEAYESKFRPDATQE